MISTNCVLRSARKFWLIRVISQTDQILGAVLSLVRYCNLSRFWGGCVIDIVWKLSVALSASTWNCLPMIFVWSVSITHVTMTYVTHAVYLRMTLVCCYIWAATWDFQQCDMCDQQSNKVAKIRNRYNQVPHLTQDTNGKVTNSQKTPQTRAKRSALSQQVTTKHI